MYVLMFYSLLIEVQKYDTFTEQPTLMLKKHPFHILLYTFCQLFQVDAFRLGNSKIDVFDGYFGFIGFNE